MKRVNEMQCERPNIICIVADDLGYADLGCYGGREPISPRLDELARNGILFSQGYANSSVCSPTRYALITGRYQYHWRGAADEPMSSSARGSAVLGLPPRTRTLPQRLAEVGYKTKLIGKWHLGYPPHFGPLLSGYHEFFGCHSGGVGYYSHRDTSGAHDLWSGDQPVHADEYLTDLLSRAAVDYVDRAGRDPGTGSPFFLSLHYTAPHWPWETREDGGPADTGGNLFHRSGGSIHTYRRMIRQMDEGIGWVFDTLCRHGLADNTLVVFTSDNGGERFSDNWPLVGGKMDLTEGGIRVPWLAHWPRVIKRPRVSLQHCMTMDWTATLLEAAGADATQLDGMSLMRVLEEDEIFARPMFWRMKHREQRAHRDGCWKYLRVDGHDYLFNLDEDERERANKACLFPEKLEAMKQAWEAWNETIPPIPNDASVLPGYTAADMPQR